MDPRIEEIMTQNAIYLDERGEARRLSPEEAKEMLRADERHQQELSLQKQKRL